MDVTQNILDIHRIYGHSDNTAPHQTSSSKCLNYAMVRLFKNLRSKVDKIPFTFNYQDAVGLFGTENHFIRVNMNVIDTGTDFVAVNTYQDAMITPEADVVVNSYSTGVIDDTKDLTVVNTYEPAVIDYDSLPSYVKALVSVELTNHKTGNQYIDRDLDVRLYTKDKQEWDYIVCI